jgi:hypothetical protein
MYYEEDFKSLNAVVAICRERGESTFFCKLSHGSAGSLDPPTDFLIGR